MPFPTRNWRTLVLLFLCVTATYSATAEFGYKVVREYPHDRQAFTQGLEFRGGFLYEGTGLNGRSSLRRVKLETGQVLQSVPLAAEHFGEGITVLNGMIFQITWRSQQGFVYGQSDFRLQRQFKYTGEGWGLTNDGSTIYMSDGTAAIRCWDPFTLRETRRFTVHDGKQPIDQLNELEWMNGELLANIWGTDRIARISPKDGAVTGWVDLSGLLPFADRLRADVLNGIAYDSQGKRLFVTGKLWPRIYEIKLTPKPR
jgi:glutamine cyclotransferase